MSAPLMVSFVPWMLVVIGWLVVSRQNDARERRKDLRELVKSLSERLDRILANWSSYSMLDGSDPEASAYSDKVKSDISSLTLFMRRINQAGLRFAGESHIRLLRQQATGDDFESKSRKRSIEGHASYAMLALISMDFLRDLEAAYFLTYPVRLKGWIDFDSAFAYFTRKFHRS